MAKVTKEMIFANTETNDRGCWIWTGKVGSHGYGYSGGWDNTIHPASYKLFIGPIPTMSDTGKKMWLDHRCRNKLCVNPDHLFPCRPGLNTWLAYIEKHKQMPWKWLRVVRHIHRMVGDEQYRERVKAGEAF